MAAPSLLPKVVAACTCESWPLVASAALSAARPIPALSEATALASIDGHVSLVLCTLQFCESRMLEFVPTVTRRFPGVPCLCCRILESELPECAIQAAFDAALSAGAVEVMDVAAIEREGGREAAIAALRSRLRAYVLRAA